MWGVFDGVGDWVGEEGERYLVVTIVGNMA